MTQAPLFDGALFGLAPAPEAKPKMSSEQKHAQRSERMIANGRHPLTLLPLRGTDEPETCKTCGFIYGHQPGTKTYYKCANSRATASYATDARLKWPACILWRPPTDVDDANTARATAKSKET